MPDIGAIIQFIDEHKYWLAALLPFAIAIAVLKMRG